MLDFLILFYFLKVNCTGNENQTLVIVSTNTIITSMRTLELLTLIFLTNLLPM